ncbi:MAG: preprotein translocase subunit YajC [Odoribacteraceae bacterium]|jgi:preprotein translocase subunit YajC|nr:preprotein translocase subunit YajC [Odoribacteraceae bacterium]
MNTIFILLEGEAPKGLFGGMEGMGLMLLLLVVFWFFMIRPQAKRQKELRKYRDSLQKGDRVIAAGGIFGKILEISDYSVVIEVENQGRLKVLKEAIVKDTTNAQPAAR